MTTDNKSPAREKVIERLKKLFALGQSSNQHEAELAMQKANEIMTEYQISATDVDIFEDGEVVREDVELDGGRRSTWLTALANACANLYDARAFYVRNGSPNLTIRYVGTPADILAARMTFKHLHSSWLCIVKSDRRQHPNGDTKSFNRSHGMGFTYSIGNRIDQLVLERQAKVKSATGRDLVVVKGAVVSEFLKNMKIGTSTNSIPTHGAAFHAGFERGKSIPLHGGLEEDAALMIGAA